MTLRQTDTQKDRRTNKKTDRHTDTQTDRKTNDRQTKKKTDRQTDKQTVRRQVVRGSVGTCIRVPAVGGVVSGGEARSMVFYHTHQVILTVSWLHNSHLVARVVVGGWSAVGVEVKGHREGYVSADFVSDSTTPPVTMGTESVVCRFQELVCVVVTYLNLLR